MANMQNLLISSKVSKETGSYAELANVGVTRLNEEAKSAFRKGFIHDRFRLPR